jgi:hypothetical protein
MGISDKVEGQESLHTEGGPTGYLCTTTFVNVGCNSNNAAEHQEIKTSTENYKNLNRLQYCQVTTPPLTTIKVISRLTRKWCGVGMWFVDRCLNKLLNSGAVVAENSIFKSHKTYK